MLKIFLKNRQKGFTLFELLIAITIIGGLVYLVYRIIKMFF